MMGAGTASERDHDLTIVLMDADKRVGGRRYNEWRGSRPGERVDGLKTLNPKFSNRWEDAVGFAKTSWVPRGSVRDPQS